MGSLCAVTQAPPVPFPPDSSCGDVLVSPPRTQQCRAGGGGTASEQKPFSSSASSGVFEPKFSPSRAAGVPPASEHAGRGHPSVARVRPSWRWRVPRLSAAPRASWLGRRGLLGAAEEGGSAFLPRSYLLFRTLRKINKL